MFGKQFLLQLLNQLTEWFERACSEWVSDVAGPAGAGGDVVPHSALRGGGAYSRARVNALEILMEFSLERLLKFQLTNKHSHANKSDAVAFTSKKLQGIIIKRHDLLSYIHKNFFQCIFFLIINQSGYLCLKSS